MPATRRKQRLSTKKAKSNSGALFSPLDVRTEAHIPALLKLLRKNPTILVLLVHANWCGHCHTFMPKFKEATLEASQESKKNHSSMNPSAMIEESMVPSLNKAMSKINGKTDSIRVEGYPTVLGITPQSMKSGNTGKTIVTIPSNPEMVKQSLLAQPDNIGNANANPIGNVHANANGNANANANGNANANANGNVHANANANPIGNANANANGNANANANGNVTPATKVGQDEADYVTSLRTHGGSLYATMAQTAYTLAPAASLLATASLVMKGRRKRTQKKRHTRNKKRSRGTRRP
jgi:thiol-disulfide isomerase/thioredoxin